MTVMESFRNSSRARFFQPGFSSCIMAKVLVWREVGMMRPNNVWERSRIRESGSDSPPRESRLIAQENHRPHGAARLKGATNLCQAYIFQAPKKLHQTRTTQRQERSLL